MFEEIFDVKLSKNIFRMFLEQSEQDDGLKKERFPLSFFYSMNYCFFFFFFSIVLMLFFLLQIIDRIATNSPSFSE